MGQVAPAFEATTLAGEQVRFPSDYAGKVVLVDFWATWCAPCMQEFPHLKQVAEQLGGQNFVILGVSIDAESRIPAVRVESVVQSQGLAWPQIYEGGPDIARRFGVEALPALFLVDGDTGKILAIGDALRGDRLERSVRRYLKPAGP